MNDLTKGNTTKQLLIFAIPVLLGNVFRLFYSFADVWIIGKYLGDSSLTAVGSTSTLNDLIVGFGFGLVNGFSVIVARCFGEKDEKKLKNAVFHSAFYGIIIAAFITAVSLIFLSPILTLLNVPTKTRDQSIIYSRIILAGMMFAMLYDIGSCMLRAIGDTVIPLIMLVICSLCNVGLDILLISKFKMGVAGAAYATVISQGLSAVLCFAYIIKKYPLLCIKKEDMFFDKKMSGEIISCGLSMGLMNSLVALGTVALQSAINKLGASIIVAHTAARKMSGFFMMPFGVMAMTVASFSAQNYGAKKYDRIKSGVNKALLLLSVWSLFVVFLSYTCAPWMIKEITSTTNKTTIYNGSLYLKIDCLFYLILGPIVILRNALQAMGDHIIPVFSSFLELAGKIVFAFVFAPLFGYMGIIFTEPMVWIIMLIPLAVVYLRNPIIKKKKDKIQI